MYLTDYARIKTMIKTTVGLKNIQFTLGMKHIDIKTQLLIVSAKKFFSDGKEKHKEVYQRRWYCSWALKGRGEFLQEVREKHFPGNKME